MLFPDFNGGLTAEGGHPTDVLPYKKQLRPGELVVLPGGWGISFDNN